jgi:hypothetical protein
MNVQPQAFARLTYRAWVQRDPGKIAREARIFGTTLTEIEREIGQPGNFGDTILVLETDQATDAQVLHAYRIRRGKWLGAYDDQYRKTYPYRADKLCSVPVVEFEPVAPFRVIRDGDFVGRGDLIEGRVG